MERVVSPEGNKGWGQEDVMGGGITLKMVEMLEYDVVHTETGGGPCSI